MIKTLSFYNLKGGVGKTTLAVNIAFQASSQGQRTLLWDLDPQGAATFYLRKSLPRHQKAGKWIKGKDSPADFIIETGFDKLSIIPSGPGMMPFEEKLGNLDDSENWLSGQISQFKKTHDLVVLDCPPGLGRISQNVISASNLIVIPVIPTPLSLMSLEHMFEFLPGGRKDLNKYVLLFSMVDTRKHIHQDYMKMIKFITRAVCDTHIPYLAEIEKMGVRFEPSYVSNPDGRTALLFKEVWKELQSRLSKKPQK